MKKIALALFIFAVTGIFLFEVTHLSWIQLVCKPLIVISLIALYYSSCNREDRSPTFILALFACLAGDVFLMMPQYFIPGLISFLVGHVLYIFAYRQHQTEDDVDSLRGIQRVRLSFPIILAGTGLVVVLYPVLGDLRIPVMVYATVITAMVLVALFRYGRTASESFWRVFLGAIFFMISDSVLAINKFLSPIDNAGIYIMSTYMAAQFLIVQGILKHPHGDMKA